MAAAHEAVRLMRSSGAEVGYLDLFQDSDEAGSQHVEHRSVSFDRRGLVVSANLIG